MKLALLSDIHGNYVALEECLKYIDNNNFDGVVFLGDYITDCPYPQRTIFLVKQTMEKYKTWCIRGNREDAMINHINNPDEWTYNSQTGDLLNTYINLTDDDLSFFKNMPISQIIYLTKCKPIAVCHGSPNNVREMLIASEDNSNEWLKKIETDYLFCGHTHRPFIYEYNGKKLINCGSVGMPVNSKTNSQFTQIEFTNNEWKINLISLPYNIGALLQDFKKSGLYERCHWWAKLLAKCLQTGINYPHMALERALEISSNCNETLNEKHWKQAANELGVE
ncbi:MAG: YfcE family phosphodiesterase [Eubacteriales bacterium]|nr:YfcE family phosphodiesterase [Eubacteriales bacterium]